MEDPDAPLICARPGCWRPYPDHQPPGCTPGCPSFAWLDPFAPARPHPRSPTVTHALTAPLSLPTPADDLVSALLRAHIEQLRAVRAADAPGVDHPRYHHYSRAISSLRSAYTDRTGEDAP